VEDRRGDRLRKWKERTEGNGLRTGEDWSWKGINGRKLWRRPKL
jgi:hypothetical protein